MRQLEAWGPRIRAQDTAVGYPPAICRVDQGTRQSARLLRGSRSADAPPWGNSRGGMSSGRLSYLSISKGWRSRLACTRCHARYPASQGIINFGVNNTFYDHHGFTSTGRNFSNGPVGKLGLYLARSHFLYDIAQAVPPGSAVIEVGPGGGSRFLAERYDMLGIELSSASVRY